MPRVRPEYKGEWALEKHEFYTVYHYAMQYPALTQRYQEAVEPHAVTHTGGTGGIGKPTEDKGIKAARIAAKIAKIEAAARYAAGDAGETFYQLLLLGVTREGHTFNHLKEMGLPCGRDYYYTRRRIFYWRLAQTIERKEDKG